jgi:hypothetical protein
MIVMSIPMQLHLPKPLLLAYGGAIIAPIMVAVELWDSPSEAIPTLKKSISANELANLL